MLMVQIKNGFYIFGFIPHHDNHNYTWKKKRNVINDDKEKLNINIAFIKYDAVGVPNYKVKRL